MIERLRKMFCREADTEALADHNAQTKPDDVLGMISSIANEMSYYQEIERIIHEASDAVRDQFSYDTEKAEAAARIMHNSMRVRDILEDVLHKWDENKNNPEALLESLRPRMEDASAIIVATTPARFTRIYTDGLLNAVEKLMAGDESQRQDVAYFSRELRRSTKGFEP